MLSVEETVLKYIAIQDKPYAAGDPRLTGWEKEWDEAEVTAIYNGVISLIPAGVTKVLEIGCGDGELGHLLAAAKPGVQYEGLELSLELAEQAAVTQNAVTLSIEAANLWEYLTEVAGDWDFIVSVRCLFDDTAYVGDRELIQLIDSKAPKGFIIVAPKTRLEHPSLQSRLAGYVTSNSTGVTGSYFNGTPPAALDSSVLKTDLSHISIFRTSTTTTTPVANPRWQVVQNDKFEAARARGKVSVEAEKGVASTVDYKGIAKTGGRITGTSIKAIGTAPASAKIAEHQAKRNLKHSKKE